MTAKAAQSDEATNDEAAQDEPEQATQKNKPQRVGRKTPTYAYSPQSAARAGLLRLATEWKEAGSAYQALHAYMEVLKRYPQTGAAAAATEGLVDLANTLQKQGKFYAAMNIYDKLDAML